MIRKSLLLLALFGFLTPAIGAVDSRDDISLEKPVTKSEVDDWYLSNNFERFDLNGDGKLDGHELNRYATLHRGQSHQD